MPSIELGGPPELTGELAEVRQRLVEAVSELPSPLGDLVLAQLQRTRSPLRVGVILAAGVEAVDSAHRRHQRILLAAALELLHLALAVHQLLLQNIAELDVQELDKSWVGSIILAGDYCFSRAAILAAQTGEPTVVEVFSHALKSVSEARLRQLFSPAPLPFDEGRELSTAGLTAATYLAHLRPEEQAAVFSVGQALVARVGGSHEHETTPGTSPGTSAVATAMSQLPAFQSTRWHAIATWPPY
jgi:octaprenyl-diphosphate synthase